MRCQQRHCFLGFIFERESARKVFRLNMQLQCCTLELGKKTTLPTPEVNSIVLRQAIFEFGGSSSEPINACKIGHLFFVRMLEVRRFSLDRATLRSMLKNEKYRLNVHLFLIFRPKFLRYCTKKSMFPKKAFYEQHIGVRLFFCGWIA